MIYLKEFETQAAYDAAKDGLLTPNVSLITEGGEVKYLKGTAPTDPELYDYLYEDLTYGKDTTKTAIGICVIPPNVLPDGKARFMSVKGMNTGVYPEYGTPDEGGWDRSMPWGGKGSDIPTLTNFQEIVTGETSAEGVIDESSGEYEYPCLPKDGSYSYAPHVPSPIDYFSAYSSTGATSDLDGKSNTAKILAIDNAASTDWQTASTISEADSITTVHPAAQCCWRFSPGSTNHGDWYLPSIGELGFIIPNFSAINTAIAAVNGETLNDDHYYYSSTEFNAYSDWVISTSDGSVDGYNSGKDGFNYVRAFITL